MKRKTSVGLVCLFCAAVVLIVVSCSPNPKSVDPNIVRFSSGISGGGSFGRMVSSTSTWEPSDKIGVFMVTQGQTTTAGALGDNAEYTADAAASTSTSAFTSASPLYWPNDGTAVDFVAYHPYTASLGTGTKGAALDIEIPTDQASIGLSSIDVLWGSALNKSKAPGTASTVNIPMSHKLARFKIVVTAGTGVTALTGLEVTIKGTKTKSLTSSTPVATLDIIDGILNIDANLASEDITAHPLDNTSSSTSHTYEAIVLPDGGELKGALEVEFAFPSSSEKYTWKTSEDSNVTSVTLQAGKEYTLDLTLKKTNLGDDGLTATINSWGDGGTLTGEAT